MTVFKIYLIINNLSFEKKKLKANKIILLTKKAAKVFGN